MIPQHAKSVFKGVLFEIFQWDQLVYDGSVRVFEAAVRQEAVFAIATKKDKIIILKQSQPHKKDWYYEFPCGRMDKDGESPKETALRELLEETGMKPRRIRKWMTLEHDFPVIDRLHVFIAQGCQKVAEQELDGGEMIEVMEVSFSEFLKLLTHPRMRKTTLLKEIKLMLAEKGGRKKLHTTLFS